MNLFFLLVNNINMKKILLITLMFVFIVRVSAIENIEIDNNLLIPTFQKDIRVYNYYTNKDNVTIKVFPSKNEIINGSGKIELDSDEKRIEIISNTSGTYTINIFKNYKNDKSKESHLTNLIIKNYDIDFNKDVYDYNININDEKELEIYYELSNDNAYVSIDGNGNFNKTENIIKINVNNEYEYRIHAYKTLNVSLIENTKEYKEMSTFKKEIVKVLIVTISCILVFGFYYFMFIDKTYLKI